MRCASVVVLVAIGGLMLGIFSAARSQTAFLSKDLGLHGLFHVCAYSNGKVYSFNATQLCPLQIANQGVPGPALNSGGDRDVSLFDSTGKPVAYIDSSDGTTIYLWGGQPVAYLDTDASGGYDVYGFNGRHLGWFTNGAIWDHSGYAACAVRQRLMTVPQIAPVKGVQQIQPIRAVEQIAPIEPVLMNSFGSKSCESLLRSGAD